MSEKHPCNMTRDQYVSDLHYVMDHGPNWDFYANEDETYFHYVPKVGSTCAAGGFGNVAHFLRWLTDERNKGRRHEPLFEKVELVWKGGRYWDARNRGAA